MIWLGMGGGHPIPAPFWPEHVVFEAVPLAVGEALPLFGRARVRTFSACFGCPSRRSVERGAGDGAKLRDELKHREHR